MKTLTNLAAAACAALLAAPVDASTWNATASIATFDEAVARGLPCPAFAVDATGETNAETKAHMSIDTRLDTTVELPDGSSIVTYTGTWNGLPATISRGGGELLIHADDPDGAASSGHAIAAFDAAVASHLPAHVHLEGSDIADAHPANDSDELVLSRELDGDVIFSDGSRGRMYEATWHGAPAVVTRSGDRLDITSRPSTGIEVTGFTTLPDAGLPAAPATPQAAGAERPRSRRSTVAFAPNRLTFHMMLHDDVAGMSSQYIHANYVAWWLADLQRNMARGKKVDVLYSQDIPGVTDTPYQYVGSLHDWSDVIAAYAQEQHIPRTYKHKYMLIVKGLPELGRHGRAWQKGSDGIASISGRYPEVAHQLGHLLGAKHGNAEVRYGGWWCETNMYTPSLLVRSNCYGYSAANMRLIDDYIRTGDGFAPHLRWSEDR